MEWEEIWRLSAVTARSQEELEEKLLEIVSSIRSGIFSGDGWILETYMDTKEERNEQE